jgi:pyruvate/2-oxoglutarate dehydrogenase complex dihydrolipoamide dehydrogenase (E3) component
MQHYDAIVIGSGQAGSPLATDMAEAGWKVAIIERSHIGGTCVNTGCTPTKTMIASARVAYQARRSAEFGVHTGNVKVDLSEIYARQKAIVRESREGRTESLKDVDVYRGEGSFIGTHSIRVKMNDGGSEELSADKIFVNVGTRAKMMPIPGINQNVMMDETEILELQQLPEHLIIIGGGYVGLEFGQMFCRFGSAVTIIEAGERLTTKEDEDVSLEVEKILKEDGIEIYLNSKAKSGQRTPDGRFTLTLETPQGEKMLTGSHILMAVGRTPNTDSLKLQMAGVEADDKGYIKVNEKLETNVPGIYALGEVAGTPAFTHMTFDDYRIIRGNLLRGENCTTENRILPYTMFIDPQLGRVGMTEADAQKAGRKIKVAKMAMEGVARAKEVGETRGFMKAIVDAETDQILGCAILGYEGGEVMSMLQMAMMGKLSYKAIQDGIFAHPTLAESLNNLFTTLGK